jgi:hypothetical protein
VTLSTLKVIAKPSRTFCTVLVEERLARLHGAQNVGAAVSKLTKSYRLHAESAVLMAQSAFGGIQAARVMLAQYATDDCMTASHGLP